MKELPAIFGSQVFNDRVMKQRLPKDIYNLLKKCIAENKALDIERRRQRHEGLGNRTRRNAFYALVPAAYGYYRGKTRFFHFPHF